MKRTWRIIAGVVLIGALLLAGSPEVTANMLELFGWHKVNAGVTEIGGSNAQWDREVSGTMDVQKTTTSLAEARSFLGNGAMLPPALEGAEMLLYREVDKEGQLLVIGLSQPNKGFWARYRPANDHKVDASYGADFNVEIAERQINGKPARIVRLTCKDGWKKTQAELWLQDGSWVYELRDPMGNVDSLIKMAESMK